MANFKISGLPNIDTANIDDSTYMIVAKDGRNYRMTPEQLVKYVSLEDLDEFYTKTDINNLLSEKADIDLLSQYVKSNEIKDVISTMGYITSDDLKDYITEDELTSQLENYVKQEDFKKLISKDDIRESKSISITTTGKIEVNTISENNIIDIF